MKETKRLGNKGFSLVELIVVIAIMAVFVGVLSPQYMKWVERARLQKDNSAIGEIAQAMKLAYADEALRVEIDKVANGNVITITNADGSTDAGYTNFASGTVLQKEVAATVGNEFHTTSKTYKESDDAIVLTVDSNGNVSATGYIEVPNGEPSDSSEPYKF